MFTNILNTTTGNLTAANAIICILTALVLGLMIAFNLDYTEIFDDLFAKYTSRVTQERVKTTNLGSMYEIRYNITLRDIALEKAFIDEIRCRNGNLPVICGRQQEIRDEL